MGFVIQITNRAGRVLEYRKFATSSATIGRGFDCDLILDDPFVDRCHLRIVETCNGLLLDTTGEQGFTSIDGKQRTGCSIPVDSGVQLVVGSSNLRVYRSSHSVSPVQVFTPVDRFLATVSAPWVAVTLSVFVFSFVGFSKYISLTSEFGFYDWLGRCLSEFLTAVIWVSIWALLTRITKHDSRFLQHWVLAQGFVFVATLYQYADEALRFNLGSHPFVTTASFLTFGFSFMVLIWFHLRVAFSQRRLGRIISSACLAWGIASFGFIQANVGNEMFADQPEFEPIALPVWALLRKPLSPDRFLLESDEIFEFEVEEPEPEFLF